MFCFSRLIRRYIPHQQGAAAVPTTHLPPPQVPSTPQYLNWGGHYHHQHVTRIASAPDSYQQQWSPIPPNYHFQPQQKPQRLSNYCSDPQLNWSRGPGGSGGEDVRKKLYYHLTAIFPEEQVTHAMQMYPDEMNPQKICAAILAMFPPKS